MKKYSILMLLIGALAVFSTGCKKEGCTDPTAENYDSDAKDDDGSCTYASKGDPHAATKSAIKTTYADIVFAGYEDSYNEAMKLKTAIDAFVANPTQSGLDDCKAAWKKAREPYGQTEAFRFASGPIDAEDGPEGLLNAWPLDESYVDYIRGNTTAGIINDATTYPTLDASTLEGLNEKGGEKNISIGYHAIEFLLWGQDSTDVNPKTPGQRPYTDFLTTGGTADNQARRGDYLKLCVDMLLDHLKLMKDAWDPGKSGNYRSTFLALDNNVALKNMMTGIGTLSKSELAGERMFVALDNQDQEDEHSCFSDNTHRDIITNAQGIRNVYIGEYTRVDGSKVNGTSIQDLITTVNPTLAGEMNALSTSSMAGVNAIPVPFDYALTLENTSGNGPIMTAVTALQSQGDKITEVATALGITISTELPE
ncbi:hypothetical protein KFE98_12660 [bacterium SCSIO 12741]|nr:hypothetical protein KFE98_12660 [bacterium SCSIO 12741]